MDLEEIFTKIYSIFADYDKIIGPLSNIKCRGGNEKNILTVVSRLNKLLIDQKYVKDNDAHVNEEMLRKITFYLILNSNLAGKSDLINEPNVGHLIFDSPVLTPCLILDCIWGLNLDTFLCEILIYCPVTLTVELLKSILTSVSFSLPYPLLDRVRVIIYAIYLKIYYLKTEKVYYLSFDQAISSLLEKLIELLQFYISPSSLKMDNWGVNELYRYTGYAMQSILHLTDDCFKVYLTKPEKTISDSHKIYNIEYQVGAEKFISADAKNEKIFTALDQINQCLLSVCQANLKAINVKIFCSWCEFKFNDTDLTLQQSIQNYAYTVGEKMPDIMLEKEFFEEISQMLSSIAAKPLTIEEEINSASIDQILKHLNIENDHKKLWFKKFLTKEILVDPKCIQALKQNMKLCDCNDISTLIHMVYENRNKKIENLDEIKDFVINSLMCLSQDDQLQIIVSFFEMNKLNNFYERSDFHEKLTETFNKVLTMESLNDITILLIQNPQMVLQKVIEECFKSDEKATLMVTILKRCEKLCSMPSGTTFLGNEKLLGIVLFEEILQIVSEIELENSLAITIKKLTQTNVLSPVDLTRIVIFPKIEDYIQQKKFKSISLWLEGCYMICELETFYTLYMPVLIFLSQIFNFCRLDINTFCVEAVLVLEISIAIVTKIIDKIKAEKLLKPDDIEYIKNWLNKSPPVNRYYYEQLWSENKISLLNYLFNGKLKDHTRTWNVGRLFELLPFSTLSEWKLLSLDIAEEQPDYLELFHMLNDFIGLLSTMVSRSPSQTALSCTEYCVRNFSIILNDIICPKIADSYNAEKIVWKEIAHTVKILPKERRDVCSLQLITILLPMLDRLKAKNENIYSDIAPNLILLDKTEACALICKKMLE